MIVSNWALSVAVAAIAVVAAPLALGGYPQATYVVPASGDLAEPATLMMDRARMVIRQGELRLDYRLPKELDGNTPQRFKLAGSNAGSELSLVSADGNVTAACERSDGELSCVMTYQAGIDLDDAGAEAFIQKNVTDPSRIAELRAARGALERQAVGIIRFIND